MRQQNDTQNDNRRRNAQNTRVPWCVPRILHNVAMFTEFEIASKNIRNVKMWLQFSAYRPIQNDLPLNYSHRMLEYSREISFHTVNNASHTEQFNGLKIELNEWLS